jgi:tripartite-type tricarboxylate transporter receptor subunit TctC
MILMPRLLIVLLLVAVVWVYAPGDTLAQNYPSKPINIITPFPPGGAGDIVSRILGQRLTESWGQPVVVHNRGGGNTVIGTELAARAPADGYNLFLGQSSNMTIVPALYKSRSAKPLPYDTMRDFTPVAFVGVGPLILVVHPSLPATSVKELIALAKSHPGKLNYNSSASGGVTHLSMELLKNMAGVNIVHIPYTGGGPQVIAIMSGHVDLGFASITNTLPQVRAGKLRALAISSSERSAAAPELPTVAEAGLPGFQVDPWFGVLTPAGTAKEIVIKLNTEINKYLLDPKVREQMTKLGIGVISKTPEAFAEFLVQEMAMWTRVVKESGAKVD